MQGGVLKVVFKTDINMEIAGQCPIISVFYFLW